eukprot:TRINITY_DN6883_c0_g1_i1.p1 TRINITY_DN6883_c0_g1~~TRINITY_DN6883_c0_g1_i1.p1  ORF type:complete len:2117 (-),score=358.05 TRINITY_DN6883_c0_g1_i1:2050-7605(-)
MGAPLTAETLVTLQTTGAQTSPMVKCIGGTSFIISWESSAYANPVDIALRVFSSAFTGGSELLPTSPEVTGSQDSFTAGISASGSVGCWRDVSRGKLACRAYDTLTWSALGSDYVFLTVVPLAGSISLVSRNHSTFTLTWSQTACIAYSDFSGTCAVTRLVTNVGGSLAFGAFTRLHVVSTGNQDDLTAVVLYGGITFFAWSSVQPINGVGNGVKKVMSQVWIPSSGSYGSEALLSPTAATETAFAAGAARSDGLQAVIVYRDLANTRFLATILDLSKTQLVVHAGIGAGGNTGSVVVESEKYGTSTFANMFSYRPAPIISSVTPTSGSVGGGGTVTLLGTNLGSGSDIYNVTIGGRAADIVSQTSSQVIVTTGRALAAGSSQVMTYSTTFGYATASTSYVYIIPTISAVVQSTPAVEGGASATVSLQLNVAPSASVTVPVVAPLYTTVNPTSLIFTVLNWNTAQTVTITPTVDDTYNGNRRCEVSFGPTTSPDVDYNALSTASSGLNCTDLSVPGFNVTAGGFGSQRLGGGFVLQEGDIKYFAVQLSSRPASTVTVNVVAHNALVTVLSGALTFTAAAWNISQAINITAPRNFIVDDPPTANSVVRLVASGSDSDYAALVQDVSVVVIDGDLDALLQTVATSPSPNTTTEAGQSSTLYVIAARQFAGTAFVYLSSSIANVVVAPSTIALTAADYLQPKSVVLTATHDFIDTGVQSYTVNVTSSFNGVSRTQLISMTNINNDTATLVVSATHVVVNETGDAKPVSISLGSQPLATVLVVCGSLDTSHAVVAPTSLSFTPSNWYLPQTVWVSGVSDNNVLQVNTTTSIAVTAFSSDLKYTVLSSTVSVLNVNINWPVLPTGILPRTSAALGSNISVSGNYFMPGIEVYVNGTASSWVLFVNSSYIVFLSPVMNLSNAYTNVVLRNADGGDLLWRQGLFYTDICPAAGWYGRGLQCIPCPEGAFCPGGNRLWPTAGYWNENEFSPIMKCLTTDRCLGGQTSPCGAAYEGWACGSCKYDFYVDSDVCLPCAGKGVLALLIIAQFVFHAILIVFLMWSHDDTINNVQYVAACCRGLWYITLAPGAGFPYGLQETFNVLSLFVSDFNFIRPGCAWVGSFNLVYTINIGITVGLLAVFGVLVWLQLLKTRCVVSVAYAKDEARPEIQMWHFIQKLSRGWTVLILYCVPSIVMRCVSALSCRWSEAAGNYLLISDPTTVCWRGGHLAVFIVSIVILILLAVFAVLSAIFVSRYTHHPEASYTSMSKTMKHMSVATRVWARAVCQDYTTRAAFFGLWQMLLCDLVMVTVSQTLGNASLFDTSSFVLLALQVAPLFVVLVMLLVWRPYRSDDRCEDVDMRKNLGLAAVYLVLIIQAVSQFLMTLSDVDPKVGIILSYLVIAVLGLFVFMLVVFAFWWFFAPLLHAVRKRCCTGKKGDSDKLVFERRRLREYEEDMKRDIERFLEEEATMIKERENDYLTRRVRSPTATSDVIPLMTPTTRVNTLLVGPDDSHTTNRSRATSFASAQSAEAPFLTPGVAASPQLSPGGHSQRSGASLRVARTTTGQYVQILDDRDFSLSPNPSARTTGHIATFEEDARQREAQKLFVPSQSSRSPSAESEHELASFSTPKSLAWVPGPSPVQLTVVNVSSDSDEHNHSGHSLASAPQQHAQQHHHHHHLPQHSTPPTPQYFPQPPVSPTKVPPVSPSAIRPELSTPPLPMRDLSASPSPQPLPFTPMLAVGVVNTSTNSNSPTQQRVGSGPIGSVAHPRGRPRPINPRGSVRLSQPSTPTTPTGTTTAAAVAASPSPARDLARRFQFESAGTTSPTSVDSSGSTLSSKPLLSQDDGRRRVRGSTNPSSPAK